MFKQFISSTSLSILLAFNFSESMANELIIAKICPVKAPELETGEMTQLGVLAFSQEWFHSSRSQASYIASDNATGVGLEIHFFASLNGQIQGRNQAKCNKYRMLQVRMSSISFIDENKNQLDTPPENTEPFYDQGNLEHGHGFHYTPFDDQDKPWQGQVPRDSTLAIYDTPYISDGYGIEGEDMTIRFETCVVCEREDSFDQLLSCGQWGYTREYIGGSTGWTEPEFIPVSCLIQASDTFKETIEFNESTSYHYWINWR